VKQQSLRRGSASLAKAGSIIATGMSTACLWSCGSTTDSTAAAGGMAGDASPDSGSEAGTGGAGLSGAGGGGGLAADSGQGGLWNPRFPLGTPGWRRSTVPFCSEGQGVLDSRVWSTPEAVSVLVNNSCGPLDTSFPCVDYGQALYRNDGTGWQRIHWQSSSTPEQYARYLTGLPDGTAILLAGPCPVLSVAPQGSTNCLWSDTADVPYQGIGTSTGSLYTLFSSATQTLRRYSGEQWMEVAIAPDAETMAQAGDFVVVAGTNQVVLTGTGEGPFTPVPNVPAGGGRTAWTRGATDIILGNAEGHLVQYDGVQWMLIDTGVRDPILRVWGADDGTLYFITQSRFGRLVNGSVELLFTHTDTDFPDQGFTDLWGNSSQEVFLVVGDRTFILDRTGNPLEQCGGLFLVWFDGAEFHWF
jgi:hypothetical protein